MTSPIIFQSRSARHHLPFLFAGQAQKEFFVNEGLATVDLLLHPVIVGEADTPPAEPVDGQAWLIADQATGPWGGKDGQIAGSQAGDWSFVEPFDGLRIWDSTSAQFLLFRGGWQRLETPAAPAGGASVDTEARAAIDALIEALRNAGIFSSA